MAVAGLSIRHDRGWFDELLEDVARFGRGRLVFVGGNRQVLLRQCVEWADAVESVEAGASPSLQPSQARADALAEWTGALFNFTATAVGLGFPPAQVLAPIADLLIRAFKQRPADVSAEAALLRLVEQALARARPDNKTVVLVYDLGPAAQLLLGTLVAFLTERGLFTRERLIVLVGLDDMPQHPEAANEGHPEAVQTAARLASDEDQQEKVGWLWVPPLSATAVRQRLQGRVDEEVAEFVARYGFTDHEAIRLWDDLVTAGAVVKVDGHWTAGSDVRQRARTRISMAVAATVGDDPDDIDDVEAVLRYGALQGEAFCGESAAVVSLDPRTPDDAVSNQVIGLLADLDALASQQPPQVLSGATQVAVDTFGPVREYQFDSPWLARWLEDDVAAQDSLAYRTQLREQLMARHNDSGLYDLDIARLARLTGRDDLSTMYMSRHNSRQRQAVLLAESDQLLRAVAHWDYHNPYLADRLSDIAEHLLTIGEMEQAVACARPAVQMTQAAFQRTPDQVHHSRFAYALLQLGAALRRRGDSDEALQRLEEARTHLSALVSEAPTLASRQDLAAAIYELGSVRREQGNLEAAAEHLEEACARLRALLDEDPSPRRRRDLAQSLNALGVVLGIRGETSRGVEQLEEARIRRSQLLEVPPTADQRRDLSITLHELGVVLGDSGDLDAAVQRLQEAQSLLRELYEGLPADSNIRHDLAFTSHKLGIVLWGQGYRDRARDQLEEARTHLAALFEEQHTPARRRDLAFALRQSGVFLAVAGDLEHAVPLLEQARIHSAALVDEPQPSASDRRDLAETLHCLGTALLKRGDHSAAALRLRERDALLHPPQEGESAS